jgi:hypothetical protein
MYAPRRGKRASAERDRSCNISTDPMLQLVLLQL